MRYWILELLFFGYLACLHHTTVHENKKYDFFCHGNTKLFCCNPKLTSMCTLIEKFLQENVIFFSKKKRLGTLVLFVSLWIDYVHQIVNLCYSKDFSHRSNLLQSKDLARRWRLDREEECAIPIGRREKKNLQTLLFLTAFSFSISWSPFKGLVRITLWE